MNRPYLFIILFIFLGCSPTEDQASNPAVSNSALSAEQEGIPALKVLGVLQDGGAPHIGCNRPCCRNLFLRPRMDRKVVCLGIVDTNSVGKKVGAMIEATPDFPSQLDEFRQWSQVAMEEMRIFLTHAHIGHYSGLMFVGREALGSNQMPVWAMPRMRSFLESNGPWDQLVALQNIELRTLFEDEAVRVGSTVSLVPLKVPHRDEYSETVGFRIVGPTHSALFIPDINKWDEWSRSLEGELALVDRAYLDATFFDAAEIGYRDMSEIPHPFMVETMALLDSLPQTQRDKIHFIHLNHTNPCLDTTSEAYAKVIQKGYHIAVPGSTYPL
ncbi:MAG: MBL fold metallo-hydrolase [Bacteroidetes bacterium]|nr:MBL fold metallo-hydrolase [Bacteroidota bacterium]MDA1335346.1 MBL fold metallo-hydrolase [Bacteroidota bacterium]